MMTSPEKLEIMKTKVIECIENLYLIDKIDQVEYEQMLSFMHSDESPDEVIQTAMRTINNWYGLDYIGGDIYGYFLNIAERVKTLSAKIESTE